MQERIQALVIKPQFCCRIHSQLYQFHPQQWQHSPYPMSNILLTQLETFHSESFLPPLETLEGIPNQRCL